MPDAPEKPEKIKLKLTNGQLADLSLGLSSLDGLRTSPESFRPYKFDDENETTWLIAENISALEQHIKAFDRAKKIESARYGISNGTKITAENAENVAGFLKAVGDLEEKEIEVTGLQRISRARLKVGKGDKCNPIPPSVLGKIMPLLED